MPIVLSCCCRACPSTSLRRFISVLNFFSFNFSGVINHHHHHHRFLHSMQGFILLLLRDAPRLQILPVESSFRQDYQTFSWVNNQLYSFLFLTCTGCVRAPFTNSTIMQSIWPRGGPATESQKCKILNMLDQIYSAYCMVWASSKVRTRPNFDKVWCWW